MFVYLYYPYIVIIQIAYVYITRDYSLIVFFAMLSSALSVSAAVWDHFSQKQLLVGKNKEITRVLFSVKVTSSYIRKGNQQRSKFKHKRYYLQRTLAEMFGLHADSVEILPPGKFNDPRKGRGLILSFLIITTSSMFCFVLFCFDCTHNIIIKNVMFL